LLGAITYVAYRRARRRSRVRTESSPETDAIMWLLGGILVFWPIALAWVIHEGLKLQDKTKYWLMAIAPGVLMLTLIPLGWELYFVYGFVAAATTVTVAAMQDEES
jgi:hypothetical protein